MATVVMENGTWLCKAGFAGEDTPKTVFPAVVGKPSQMGEAAGMDPNSVYVGDKAHRKQGLLTVRHPTTDGFLSDWNDIEKIWHYAFHDELDIATKEHSILLTEPQVNPKALREKMAQMIFEDFDFPTMYIKAKEVLSLYSSGCITGVALDIGDGISCSVPACDGYAIRHAVKRSGIYGRDLTDCLRKSLNDRGYSFPSVADRDIIRNIKENLCYVASDYKKKWISFQPKHPL
ncbi:Actin, cytoplasmic type 5,Actin, cytoplasmic A3,Actin, muscle-type,Actin-75,Actin-like protein 53D,Putative actin-24,Actin, non-muscle 6.2,Actin-71,Actin-4,Actin, nonmuscle,Actin, alpha skeletal muscle 2,Actin, cytoskeletal 2A,Actin B,Actin-11,Actin-15A,Actin, cytoplasmic type 8,Actin, cytoplasmic 2,Actin, cytoplasmic 1,Actin, alpha skeletal muscle B,Actin-85C,Actin, spherule isoform,Actin-57B,Actin, acrosomal process isoform,Actin, muscle-type A2,Actin-5,Actin-100,Actin-93,Actin,Centractin,Actin-18,POTE a|uniref:Actin n=1 Tax=Mytilus edulis TaxID=6550 RepID=A0A8S3VSK0_MYTED|nr:Actin, cytoplasmic type 5,Actin, cytoplasmic A3,Actin, muscle-type,Actin-75,Actin-like protein 53D,Putative actin-24,Actin, non-muscle 6.2,Actin-71,Actin-4,Actin, nonmuscle,Actin, alpha skeletal muscle 2,Actin, cytoskeletal 2A,Actin B,Actin-11,Actin-15A,Actin, cytoplasmic type 8,Actin, cytoplasmic 2,Actin, cytoplasmic 1,Actin, alpha skeletal muscle B,Actin-85C,Actin, spherule isoform,Actin-57B,Actin, acrosomal process isoform,Actin, muscle-type A2,Actin-5,Actin-100,Actin-93,Actin,Centractin,Acti